MRKTILLAILAPTVATAQIQASASFSIDLPTLVPPMVVIQPGIQVIPDLDVEVFHADGFYWTRRDGAWFRSDNPRHGWRRHPHGYPPGLGKLQPGKYRRWKPGHAGGGGPKGVVGKPGKGGKGGKGGKPHKGDRDRGEKHGKKH